MLKKNFLEGLLGVRAEVDGGAGGGRGGHPGDGAVQHPRDSEGGRSTGRYSYFGPRYCFCCWWGCSLKEKGEKGENRVKSTVFGNKEDKQEDLII